MELTVGSRVVVTSKANWGGLTTTAMEGCVLRVDEKAGVCVRLFISAVFEPAFWYKPADLALSNNPQTLPLTAESIEGALGGRNGRWSPTQSKILLGALRSWLIQRARARAGQSVYEAASKASWSDLCVMYQDINNTVLARWLDANDTRPKRPQIVASDVELAPAGFSVRRPKMD